MTLKDKFPNLWQAHGDRGDNGWELRDVTYVNDDLKWKRKYLPYLLSRPNKSFHVTACVMVPQSLLAPENRHIS